MRNLILLLLLLLLGIGLVYFAFLGAYNRNYADDWCLNAHYKELGLRETLAGYTHTTSYSASRFSLTLFAGLLFPFGLPGLQVLTLIVIATLFLGLANILKLLSEFLNLGLPKTIRLAGAALVTYFAIYIAPHQYQSFYWLIGILAYTAPLLFTLWIIILIGRSGQRETRAVHTFPLLGLLAFFAGGFSEAGTAYLLTILAIILFVSLFFREKTLWAQRLLIPAIWGLSFALLAALILALAPTSWERFSRYGEQADLVQFVGLTIRYSWDFVRLSIQDLPLPHLALAATASLLAFLSPHAEAKSQSERNPQLLTAFTAIAMIAFLLIAATYAPSALIEKNPPHPRTRVIARTTMLFSLTMLFWLAARWLAAWKRFSALRFPATILIALLCLVYIGRSLTLAGDLQPIFSERASIWDQRNAILISAAQAGQYRVEVPAIDGLPIGGLRDFRQAATHWVNSCAARVYGVGEISGLP